MHRNPHLVAPRMPTSEVSNVRDYTQRDLQFTDPYEYANPGHDRRSNSPYPIHGAQPHPGLGLPQTPDGTMAPAMASAAPPAARNSRKRKSPPTAKEHPTTLNSASLAGGGGGYEYSQDPDYIPGADGVPQSPPNAGSNQAGRILSTSKRAEQNRKAQRAFRERRDAHVKALETRSQMLDAALASAEEANRRWEESRLLVEQLRTENAALRAALGQAAVHHLTEDRRRIDLNGLDDHGSASVRADGTPSHSRQPSLGARPEDGET